MIKLYFKGFSFEYCFTVIDMGIFGNQESYEIKYISAPTGLMMGALQEESITRKGCYEILQLFYQFYCAMYDKHFYLVPSFSTANFGSQFR